VAWALYRRAGRGGGGHAQPHLVQPVPALPPADEGPQAAPPSRSPAL